MSNFSSKFSFTLLLALVTLVGWGQTNPTPHNLSTSSFSFTGFGAGTTTTYPTSMQGHGFSSERTSANKTDAATSNIALSANSTAFTTSSIRNEVASGVSLLSSGSANFGTIVVALDATNRQDITLGWTCAEMSPNGTNGNGDRQNAIELQYRIGTTGSWTAVSGTTYQSNVSSASFASPQTFSNIVLPSACNNQAVVQVRWLYYFVSGTGSRDRIGVDEISVSSTPQTSCTAPTTQASALTTNSPTTDGFSTAWTAGNGNGTMIVVRPTAQANAAPVSGTSYTPNLAWGSAGQINTNNRVVFRASGTSAGPITGLTAETQYTITVYEYNNTGDCYNLTSPPSTTRFTLSTEPSAHAASFTNSVVSFDQINLSYTAPGSGADGYVILRRADGVLPTTSGVEDGVAPGSWSLPSGTVVANANATGTSWNNTGLTGSTNYCYLLIPFNWNGTDAQTYNYRTAATVPSTCGTTPAAPSLNSDIILSSMTYTSNIVYTSFQAPASLTNTSGNVGVMGITIRDGGATSPDADALPTILSSITFSGITGTSMIRTAALFEGNTMIANSPTINVGANTIAFSGLSYSCADNSTRDLTLRVSFLTAVTDNLQMTFSVTNANVTTASGATSSQMSAFTTLNSSTTGDRNRIEVSADRLAFVQGPSNAPNGASMSPSVTVRGIDVNTNLDLDFTGSVTVACSTPAALTSGGSATAVSGVATFGSIVHGTDGTYTMSANSSGLTSSSASSPYTITTVTFTTGDYRTNPAFSGTVFFGSTNPVSGISPWQSWNGSAWVDVTHSTGSPLSPQNLATKPGTIYVGGGSGVTYVDAAGGGTFNNIIVEFPVSTSTFYSGNSITGLRIATGNSLDIKRGTFYLDGLFELQGSSNLYVRSNNEMYITGATSTTFTRNASSTFEVENDAYVQIDAYLPNFSTTGIWNGTEIFHPQSWFYFTDWSDANPLFTGTTISTTTQGGYSACFGHLTIDIPTTGLANNWTGVLPASTNVNLTHGDFEIYNDETDNVSLYSGNTSAVVVGGNLVVGGTGNVQFQTGAGILNFTVKGNVTKNGTGNFRLHTFGSASTGNDVIFNIDGNLTVNDGFFVLSTASASGTSETINLKGNLQKLLAGYMTQANSSGFANSSFNFTGTSTQTVDVILQNSNDMLRYRFFVKSGAYVQIIDQDWRFATDSRLTVEDGGTLDFGFNGTTALNLTETVSSATTLFALNQRGTLKITSPLGITAATSLTGNVQLDTRTYNQVATFWYIGKANQVTGNGITTGSSGKIIICDLIDNNTQLSFTNSTGITNNTAVSATGGKLDIRKGQVIESTTAFISGSTGTLYMEPGTLYQIAKGSSSATDAYNDLIPRVIGGTFPYILNGGTIELNGTGSSDAFQVLRGSQSRPNYINIKYSGANTLGTDYKALSTATVIDSSLIITGSTVVDCINSANQAASFTGAGALVMDGGRLRIKKLNDANPELDGTAMDYNLTGGTVEFYGTSNTQQQKIRGSYGSPSKTIQYFNVDVNAVAGNYTSGANGGNVDLNESFTIQGAVNVNSPAVLRMDAADFIYKFTGNTTNSVNINDGAGLYYGSPFGITTVAQGGTGLDPDLGSANPSAGNIRTNNRSFSSLASYGFVSASTMASGSGLPSNIVSLYVNRNNAGDLVNLTNSVTLSDTLKFQNAGIVVTGTSNTIFVNNTSIDAVKGGAVSGTDKYVQGRLQRKINSGSTYSFPIGHSSQNAQGFSITPTGTNGSDILGFLEANSSSPLQPRAYCDLETKTAAGQQIGQGTAGTDGALDLVTFNLASPLQWDVTNPGGGVTSYDITVNANGGQDISPVTSAGGTAIRYLMKNGEPGNTGVSTGTGGADYPSTGFLACPNGYSLSGMTSFSDFTLDGANASNTGLPVVLTYFTARKEGETSILNWMTSLEIDNDRFEIERKTNQDFEYIGKVNGNGNSTSPIRYQFADETPVNGWNYYRLKQVDFDGKFEYSNIVALYFDNNQEISISFYPNPVNNNLFVSVNDKDAIIDAALYNSLGQEIRKIKIDSDNDVSDLSSGSYVIKINAGLQVITKQFVKF